MEFKIENVELDKIIISKFQELEEKLAVEFASIKSKSMFKKKGDEVQALLPITSIEIKDYLKDNIDSLDKHYKNISTIVINHYNEIVKQDKFFETMFKAEYGELKDVLNTRIQDFSNQTNITFNQYHKDIKDTLKVGSEALGEMLQTFLEGEIKNLNTSLEEYLLDFHTKTFNKFTSEVLRVNGESLKDLEYLKYLERLQDLQKLDQLNKLNNLDSLKNLDSLQNLIALPTIKNQLTTFLEQFEEKVKYLEYLDSLKDLDELVNLENLVMLKELDKLKLLDQIEIFGIKIDNIESTVNSKINNLDNLKLLDKLNNLELLNRLESLSNLTQLNQLSQLTKLDNLDKLSDIDKLQEILSIRDEIVEVKIDISDIKSTLISFMDEVRDMKKILKIDAALKASK